MHGTNLLYIISISRPIQLSINLFCFHRLCYTERKEISMYQTILFDLDGTLTDSGQGILNSVAYALEKWESKNQIQPI